MSKAKAAAQESDLGTATSYHGLKRDCAVEKTEAANSFPERNQVCYGLFCFWEDLSCLIVDLTFHGQWHDIVPVPRQPPCSGSFARVWKPTYLVLPIRTGASVEVV